MGILRQTRFVLGAAALGLAGSACERPAQDNPAEDSVVVTTPPPAMPVTYASYHRIEVPVTLPVLDAFLSDSSFAEHLRTRLSLTAPEVDSLRQAAREETAKLRETTDTAYTGTTWAATELAAARISAILGEQRATELMELVRYYWSDAAAIGSDTSVIGMAGDSTRFRPGNVPSDTRIVVNAPAYRMDLFENGKLVKTYKIGIGYPEFPLPTGMRTAERILFNPTWTPPDEPWVEGSGKVKAGQTVAAGSKLNPLGIAKIPIGLPSLIHGGKSEAQLGGFASHGCVGLTNAQMREFSTELARMGGAELNRARIQEFAKKPSETREVSLESPVPIELRYETIVVEAGAVHVFRDVYGYGTNTDRRLQEVLAAYGISTSQLTEPERTALMGALAEMARGPAGEPAPAVTRPDSAPQVNATTDRVTKTVTGKKEVVVTVAALAGKGYPAPVKP
ncbi:MAG: L,D-transpeptidase [Gemmatimonadales bacterium]|nr:L,D-transpeptidase [Gemmatimonadales bacterium]